MRGAAKIAESSNKPELKQVLTSLRVLRELLVYAWPHRRLFFFSALLIPLIALCQLMQPYIIKVIIDQHIASRNLDMVLLFSGFFLLFVAGQGLTSYFQSYTIALASQKSLHDLRTSLLRHILKLPQSFFDRSTVGGLVSRVTSDVESINELFVSGVVSIVRDLVVLIGIIIAMFSLNAKLALISFVTVPFLVLFVSYLQTHLKKYYAALRRSVGKLNAYQSEYVSGIEVAKLFQSERRSGEEFGELSHQNMRVAFRMIRADSILSAIVEFLQAITLATVIWYGAKLIAAQYGAAANPLTADLLTFGTLVAFIEYIDRFFSPLRDLSGKFSILQMASAAGERIIEILRLQPESEVVGDPEQSVELTNDQDIGIEFRDVHLSYREDQPVLKNINLKIQPLEHVALVGATGSGKTSIARLLLRLYPIQSGEIHLTQGDRRLAIQQIPLQNLRRKIGMIAQDVTVFAGTVAENVVLSMGDKEQIDLQRLEEVARLSQLSQHVGLQQRLGERGFNLSAGQRQLLAFARILYFDPPFVIFDEATSNVDPQTEKEIQVGLELVLRKRTALIIAHRLSTIMDADRIVFLDKGKIIASGPHKQLMQSSSQYLHLVEEYRAGVGAEG